MNAAGPGLLARWLAAWLVATAFGGCAQGGPATRPRRRVPEAGPVTEAGFPESGPPDGGGASEAGPARDCLDRDRDGYGQGPDCLGPDCNDGDPSVHPGATETCDGRDEDCSGTEDDGAAADDCPLGPGVARASCTLGTCGIGACQDGLGDCDGDPANGCETDLRTSADHCGACETSCSLPNAETNCMAGSCTFVRCLDGFGDCDGDPTNGCERRFGAGASACGTATDVGSFSGDVACGFLCGDNTAWSGFATRTGNGSAWFKARVHEGSNCSARIEHRITLQVPAGTNYDLFVYRACGASPVAASQRGDGQQEQVTVGQSDSWGSDDDFDYWVEVRLVSGSPCASWTLQFDGHAC